MRIITALVLALGASLLPLSLKAQNDGSFEPQPSGPTFSPATSELVRMAEAGVSEDILLAYIRNSDARYNLSADDILYMKDEGFSTAIVTEMLNHDRQVPANAPVQPAPQPPVNQNPYDQRLYTSPAPNAALEAPVQQEPAPLAPGGPPPTYVSDAPQPVSYFYQDLAPHGTWVNLEGYGWCWQPHAVTLNADWRPYCDSGHWVYSDAGWYWQSDYTWGWAPFHYGRWHHHERVGWVWFPDTVWAPSWVVWRTSGEHCGWAPLPFRAEFDVREGFRYNGARVRADFDFGLGAGLFTFIAFRDFDRHDYRQHRLPPQEVTRVYNNTTIINNYTINENHTVVNRGISKEHVESATHAKLPTVAVHDAPARSGGSRQAPAAVAGVVYKHELKAPAAPPRMMAQKVDQSHPVVQHASIVAPPRVGNSPATSGGVPHPRPGVRPTNLNNFNGPSSNYVQPGHQPVPSTTTVPQPHHPPVAPNNSLHPQSNYAPSAHQPASAPLTSPQVRQPSPVVPPASPNNLHPQNGYAPVPAHQPAPTPTTAPPLQHPQPLVPQANPNSRPQNSYVPPPVHPATPTAAAPAPQIYHPLTANPTAPVVTRNPAAIPQNDQLYNPKSYHQPNEIHTGPPVVHPSQNPHPQPTRQTPPQPPAQPQHPSNTVSNAPEHKP